MLRLTLPISALLFAAGSSTALFGQAMVENALGAGRAATTTAPAGNLGKSINGLANGITEALKGAKGAGTNSSGVSSESARPTTTHGTEIPAPKPGSTFESPMQIQEGMAYEDVIRRFGPPNLQITDGPGSKSLAYSSKDGGVKVEVQDGKVSSVEKPKS